MVLHLTAGCLSLPRSELQLDGCRLGVELQSDQFALGVDLLASAAGDGAVGDAEALRVAPRATGILPVSPRDTYALARRRWPPTLQCSPSSASPLHKKNL
jgi:hypothetical protein